eukprot:m.229804 g.229804  ORF g.229804 m.229804 type:complete len:310 (-) comp11957_c0_seq1:103-1032(-)
MADADDIFDLMERATSRLDEQRAAGPQVGVDLVASTGQGTDSVEIDFDDLETLTALTRSIDNILSMPINRKFSPKKKAARPPAKVADILGRNGPCPIDPVFDLNQAPPTTPSRATSQANTLARRGAETPNGDTQSEGIGERIPQQAGTAKRHLAVEPANDDNAIYDIASPAKVSADYRAKRPFRIYSRQMSGHFSADKKAQQAALDDRISTYPWFVGTRTRDHVEPLLQNMPTGTALVRRAGDSLVLSVLGVGGVVHHLQIAEEAGGLSIAEREVFAGVPELVRHYASSGYEFSQRMWGADTRFQMYIP